MAPCDPFKISIYGYGKWGHVFKERQRTRCQFDLGDLVLTSVNMINEGHTRLFLRTSLNPNTRPVSSFSRKNILCRFSLFPLHVLAWKLSRETHLTSHAIYQNVMSYLPSPHHQTSSICICLFKLQWLPYISSSNRILKKKEVFIFIFTSE